MVALRPPFPHDFRKRSRQIAGAVHGNVVLPPRVLGAFRDSGHDFGGKFPIAESAAGSRRQIQVPQPPPRVDLGNNQPTWRRATRNNLIGPFTHTCDAAP